jgi:replicative DNA helicase
LELVRDTGIEGRDAEYIPRPALTLGLMIQPAVLQAIAGNPAFRGRGFLARVLYAFPRSKVGYRDIAPKPIDAGIVEDYNATVGKLAAGLVGWVDDPAVLMLTPAAHGAVTTLQEEVEPQLRVDGTFGLLRDWGAKYVGAVMRIAGIIHLDAGCCVLFQLGF